MVDAIQTLRAQRGLTHTLTADTIKTRPAVVLAAFLRQLHHHDDHPRLPHLTPDQLRCHQPACDHGWITLPPSQAHPGVAVTRCTHCRPGAWPAPTHHHYEVDGGDYQDNDSYADDDDDDEPPF